MDNELLSLVVLTDMEELHKLPLSFVFLKP